MEHAGLGNILVNDTEAVVEGPYLSAGKRFLRHSLDFQLRTGFLEFQCITVADRIWFSGFS